MADPVRRHESTFPIEIDGVAYTYKQIAFYGDAVTQTVEIEGMGSRSDGERYGGCKGCKSFSLMNAAAAQMAIEIINEHKKKQAKEQEPS